jgi:hypothetical protein
MSQHLHWQPQQPESPQPPRDVLPGQYQPMPPPPPPKRKVSLIALIGGMVLLGCISFFVLVGAISKIRLQKLGSLQHPSLTLSTQWRLTSLSQQRAMSPPAYQQPDIPSSPQSYPYVQQRLLSYPALVRPTPSQQRRSRHLWFVVGIVALILWSGLGAMLLATYESRPASPSQVTHQSPTPPTQAPPTQAPPTLKPLQSTGPMILGEDINTFIIENGPPASNLGRYYVFSNPAVDIITAGRSISAIFVSAPNNAMWSVRKAATICLPLAPRDSIYKRSISLLDPQGRPIALQKVYYSASLSKRFPASVFTDEHAKQTTPGTFGMVLTYNVGDTSKVMQCAVQAGLQQE